MPAAQQPQLRYWSPGENRRLRLFFSHRWDRDSELYEGAIRSLANNPLVGTVQDLSVPRDGRIQGPRGGSVGEHVLLREIACRIYTSDLMIAPSRPGAGNNEWVSWEVETAALCYSIPVLFVREPDAVNNAQLVSGLRSAGARVDVCGRSAAEIAFSAVKLLMIPKNRGVIEAPASGGPEYRGPLESALDNVLKTHPYQPTLA
jgi:hypothetical protein